MCEAAVSHSRYSTLNSPSYSFESLLENVISHYIKFEDWNLPHFRTHIWWWFCCCFSACEIRDEAGENGRGERKRWGKVFHLLSFLSIRLLSTCSVECCERFSWFHHITRQRGTQNFLSGFIHPPHAFCLSCSNTKIESQENLKNRLFIILWLERESGLTRSPL